ncbi:MAG: glycoside hydrolase family 18 protein [Waddliaceae bacterium]
MDNYLSYGVPADKILLGIPVYGWVYDGISNFSQIKGPGSPFMRAGNPALLSYFEIADLIFSKKFSLNFDPETETAYAYSTEKGQWISFDTPSTTKQKVNEAKKRGLAGVIFWSIDQDEYQWEPKFPNIRVSLDP